MQKGDTIFDLEASAPKHLLQSTFKQSMCVILKLETTIQTISALI